MPVMAQDDPRQQQRVSEKIDTQLGSMVTQIIVLQDQIDQLKQQLVNAQLTCKAKKK